MNIVDLPEDEDCGIFHVTRCFAPVLRRAECNDPAGPRLSPDDDTPASHRELQSAQT
jgi:hypothetical protein